MFPLLTAPGEQHSTVGVSVVTFIVFVFWIFSRHISRIQTLSFQASLFLSSEDEREALVAFVKKLEDGNVFST